MRLFVVAALAACVAAPCAWASYPAAAPFDSGNGNLQTPQITQGICGYQADNKTARPCNPGEAPPGSAGGSSATTPASSPYTTSSTAGTPTQVSAADSARKDEAFVYPATATGVITIYENAGTAASYYLQPGQTYRAASNGLVYQGPLYASSTVPSDTAAVTVYH